MQNPNLIRQTELSCSCVLEYVGAISDTVSSSNEECAFPRAAPQDNRNWYFSGTITNNTTSPITFTLYSSTFFGGKITTTLNASGDRFIMKDMLLDRLVISSTANGLQVDGTLYTVPRLYAENPEVLQNFLKPSLERRSS